MPRLFGRSGHRQPDPTPQEISAHCAEIRSTWSELEHRVRASALVGLTQYQSLDAFNAHDARRSKQWTPPTVTVRIGGGHS